MQTLSTAYLALHRYVLAGIGPVSSAIAQFTLSMLLLHSLSASEFGSFSFLLVASFFAGGIWSALFCAPLPVLLAQTSDDARPALIAALFTMSRRGAVIAIALFAVLGALLNRPWPETALFVVYVALFLLRWLARAYAYAANERARTMHSDITYAVTLIVGIGALFFAKRLTLEHTYAVMAISVMVGFIPFGIEQIRQQFCAYSAGAAQEYRHIWQRHSGWSFLGVISTEATANAHVYLVTMLAGPAAYAPLAATALMIRPIGVVQNALEEFERARMATKIASGNIDPVLKAVVQFRLGLISAFIATAIALSALYILTPNMLFPEQYVKSTLLIGTVLWMAVAAIRAIRAPQSAMLQAAGRFRPLSQASMISCGLSIYAVLALLLTTDAVFSIVGIFLGEVLFCVLVHRKANQWLASQTMSSQPAYQQPQYAKNSR